MTEITLDGEQIFEADVSKSISKVISAVLMVLGLICSVYLLNWAVKNRIDSIEEVGNSQITAAMRERQLSCLAMNIYKEAGGEPFEGKAAVAQVTINRANSGKFPGDICKVVYQKDDRLGLCQFSWYCQNNSVIRPKNNSSYNESMEVAKKVLLEGFALPSLKDALYFHSVDINPKWPHKKVAVIGRHVFYN
jgi:spore germination cell wall hydrolase CwlJ-like protein